MAGALALSGNWSAIWPICSANQLLAGLALLSVSVWLMRRAGLQAYFLSHGLMLIVTPQPSFLIRSNLAAQNYVLGILVSSSLSWPSSWLVRPTIS